MRAEKEWEESADEVRKKKLNKREVSIFLSKLYVQMKFYEINRFEFFGGCRDSRTRDRTFINETCSTWNGKLYNKHV